MTTGQRKDILCDQCEDEQALSFCGECMDKLGEFCKEAHTRQKRTKDHALDKIESVKLLKLKVSCSLCNGQSERFCQECEACLCTKCSDSHHQLSDVQTSTAHTKTLQRGDNLILDSTNDSTSSMHDSPASQPDVCEKNASGVCDLCDEEHATMYCDECKLKLGDFCQRAHTKQKLTKNHHLIAIPDSFNVPCSSCDKFAEKFCSECEVHLCSQCAGDHHKLGDTLASTTDKTYSDGQDKNQPILVEMKADLTTEMRSNVNQTSSYGQDNTILEPCTVEQNNEENILDEKTILGKDDISTAEPSMDKTSQLSLTASESGVKDTNNDRVAKFHCPDQGDDSDSSHYSEMVATAIDTCSTKAAVKDGPETMTNRPGKPTVAGLYSNSVDIIWAGLDDFHKGDVYQVRIENTQTGKWESQNFETNSGKIRRLQQGSTYVFKVRLVYSNGDESKFSDSSEEVTTHIDKPGKPVVERLYNDSVDIIWTGLQDFSRGDVYQVQIENTKIGRWESQDFQTNSGHIRRLQQGSTYVFKVRLVYANGDKTEFSEKSDVVTIPIDRPGKPTVERLYNDSVDIIWTGLQDFSKGDVYQVRIENTKTGKWESQDFETNSGKIRCLQQGTTYVFKVRLVYSNRDESKYSEKSEEVTTHTSYASKILCKSVQLPEVTGRPNIYRLPMEERMEAKTTSSRKFDIGPTLDDINEKTIMLVGATGTGKSTFVDAIANYLMGVTLGDTFRFTVMQEEDIAKQQDQAVANTEIITCYSFNSNVGTVHSGRLTVVDTPGFGDMRGPERDVEIVKQIQQLFDSPGEKGIQMIDAICIFIKAPDARLTPTQTYIFNAIMSMFGNDIAGNMCTVITFSDGDTYPKVMAAVKASGLPFGKEFTFNNLAFIADPKCTITSVFWDKSLDSFSGMFKHLDTLETKSMQLTKDVLRERQNLTLTCQNLVKRIKEGISSLQSLKAEIDLLQENENEINKNRNYTYEVTDQRVVQRNLPVGIHVTNCLDCNRTCHENCAIADDDGKRGCVAMDGEGYCKQCPNTCFWDRHKNMRYAIDSVEEKVQKTYDDVLKRYQEAKGQQLSLQQLVKEKRKKLEKITADIESMLEKMKHCNNRLKEISLRPNPLGLKDQLDLMILAEQYEGKEGYQKRIEVLKEFRERATIDESVQTFKTEESSVTALYNTLHVL